MAPFRLTKRDFTTGKTVEFQWDSVVNCRLKDSGSCVVRHTLKIKPEHRGVWVPMGRIMSCDVGRTLIIDRQEDGRFVDYITD